MTAISEIIFFARLIGDCFMREITELGMELYP